jgi:hypothetical protein
VFGGKQVTKMVPFRRPLHAALLPGVMDGVQAFVRSLPALLRDLSIRVIERDLTVYGLTSASAAVAQSALRRIDVTSISVTAPPSYAHSDAATLLVPADSLRSWLTDSQIARTLCKSGSGD